MRPIEQKLHDKLTQAFAPSALEIINESHKHAKHKGFKEMDAANPETANNTDESHFRLFIQSDKFNGVSRLNRQRMVLDAIAEEMKVIHAMAMNVRGSGE